MSWLDLIERQARDAIGKPVVPARSAPAKLESAWIQTKPQTFGVDAGAVEPIYYVVSEGVVSMCNEAGELTGVSAPIRADENPRAVAGRLGREAWAKKVDSFNRPLGYARTVYV